MEGDFMKALNSFLRPLFRRCGCGCGYRVQKQFVYGHYARVMSQKTRQRISAANKGRPSEKKGIKTGLRSAEVRAKISAALKGKPRPGMIGRPLSAKRYEALCARVRSPESRQRHSALLRGRTKENHQGRRVQAEKIKAWWAALDPVDRADHVSRSAKGLRGIKRSYRQADPEVVRQRNAGIKANWASMDPLKREERLKKMYLHSGPTSCEREMKALLDGIGIQYVAQHGIGRYFVDFYLPAQHLVIEVDGDYWHSLPGAKERDAKRARSIRAHRVRLVRVLESKLKKDSVGVRAFIESIVKTGDAA